MQRKIRKNNSRVNYNQLVDLLNNYMDIQETKNRKINDILVDIKSNLDDRLCVVQDWKTKHINIKTVTLLERLVPEDVTPQQVYTLLRRFLEYRMDGSSFHKIQNVYTLLRYYENPKDVQLLATNWKQIMNKN